MAKRTPVGSSVCFAAVVVSGLEVSIFGFAGLGFMGVWGLHRWGLVGLFFWLSFGFTLGFRVLGVSEVGFNGMDGSLGRLVV